MMTATTTNYVFVYDHFLKDAVKHVKIVSYINTWVRAEVAGKLYQLPTGMPILVEEENAKKSVEKEPGLIQQFHQVDAASSLVFRANKKEWRWI